MERYRQDYFSMTTMVKIQHLSNDLYLYMSSFLDDSDRINFGSCCVRFVQDLLTNHLRFIILRSKSKFFDQYRKDEDFRTKFKNYVLFPERQLHVTGVDDDGQAFSFPKIYSLSCDLQEFQQSLLPVVERVHSLDIHMNASTLLQGSGLMLTGDYGLKSLILSNDGSRAAHVPVIPPLSLESLELKGPFSTFAEGFVDVFSHLQQLALYSVDIITDMNLLVNIQKIKLYQCNNITNISPLQYTKDITISGCIGILDYRNALTYSLKIEIISPNPRAQLDVCSFKAVQKLTLLSIGNSLPLTFSPTLKRLSIKLNTPLLNTTNFSQLQELTIMRSLTIKSVELFGCIPILTLAQLENLHSLQGLGYDENPSNKNLKNRRVTLENLQHIQDFTPLNSIPSIAIYNCQRFHDISQVKDVKNLDLEYQCSSLLKLSFVMSEIVSLRGRTEENNIFIHFPYVKELTIIGLEGKTVRSLGGLETLKNLERIILPNNWEEVNTKGWEMLKNNYSKFIYNSLATVYVRKQKK